jgi:TorA maturation chaperone TorD
MNVRAQQVARARLLTYQFLSIAFSEPRARRWSRLRNTELLKESVEAAGTLREAFATDTFELAPGEMPPVSLDLHEFMRCIADPAFDPDMEYQQTFGLMMSKRHPPYESEYCPQTFSVYRAQVIADVAGFYRAFGLEPSRDMPERHDHLALQLEFMAWLIAKAERARQPGPGEGTQERVELCEAAARRFFQQHIAWWAPAFAQALRRRSSRFYRALADLLAAFVHIERVLLDVPAPRELVAPQRTEDTDANCEQCCSIAVGVT